MEPSDQRGGATVAFDTQTNRLVVLRDLPVDLCGHIHLTAGVGNKLYAIESEHSGLDYCGSDGRDKYCRGGLHCLKLDNDDDDAWNWYSYNFPLPVTVSLVLAPFDDSVEPVGNLGSRAAPTRPRPLRLRRMRHLRCQTPRRLAAAVRWPGAL